MAYEPFGFWDRRNPLFGGGGVKPMGYDPRKRSGVTGSWNEAMGPEGPVDPEYYRTNALAQLMAASGLRDTQSAPPVTNAAVSTTPRTPRPQAAAPGTPDGTPPGHPSSHEPVPIETPAIPVSGSTPGMPSASAANIFGLSPEQVQDRENQRKALQNWQMGLATTGLPYAEANKLQEFGQSFKTPAPRLKSGAGRLNAALSGGAEGYFMGRAMKERKEVAEMIRQLRDQYAGSRDADRANAALGQGGGGGDLSSEGTAGDTPYYPDVGGGDAFDMSQYDMSQNMDPEDYWKMNWGL